MDLIIGAGISGISYANFTNNPCLIIEKDEEIGGYCRTIKRSGFVWDYSGHFFHFQHPQIENIVCKNMNKAELISVDKLTSILYNGIYIDFPFQKNIHQLPKSEFIDCLYDLFATKDIKEISSFKDMIYANLGRSISEKFLIPYNEKLYACDLNLLDQDAMGRFFPKVSKEDIILNFKNSIQSSYNQKFIYPKGGAIEYINSMRSNIKDIPIIINEELIEVDLDKKIAITNCRCVKYDNLISTIPFPQLLQKCGIRFDTSIFTSNKVLVFNLGFDRKGNDKKSSWIYVPDKEVLFYRIGYYDNIMQTDKMSVYVEIGFPENQHLRDYSYYLDKILSDMYRCGFLQGEKLIDYEAILMDPAYVHINKSSTEALSFYKVKLSEKNVYSIGRYGSWTYCSIEDNIIEASNLAKKIGI